MEKQNPRMSVKQAKLTVNTHKHNQLNLYQVINMKATENRPCLPHSFPFLLFVFKVLGFVPACTRYHMHVHIYAKMFILPHSLKHSS